MSFLGDIRDSVGQAFCSGFEAYDDIARYSAGLLYPERVGEVYPNSPAGGLANTGIAFFCNRPPVPPDAPPFQGGQCEGVRYRVTVDVIREFDGENIGSTVNVVGPVRGAEKRVSGSNESVYVLFGPLQSDGSPSEIFVTASGNPLSEPVISNIERIDGLPDDCGNPEENYPPLPPDDRTFPIIINNNSGQIVFGDGNLNINGDLTVPFFVNNVGIDFSGELVLNTGDVIINFGGLPSNPECEIEPPTTDEPPPPPDEPEEPEEGLPTIVGVVVVSSVSPSKIKATEVGQQDSPNIFVPKLGHVSFKIKIGESYHWTSDIYVKNKNNYIQNPSRFPAVAVAGTPEAGVSWQLTPVKAVPERYDLEV